MTDKANHVPEFADVIQVDPESNPGMVMGPGDEVPRPAKLGEPGYNPDHSWMGPNISLAQAGAIADDATKAFEAYASENATEEGMPEIKDSGERKQFASGMVRDTDHDKVDYLLPRDGPMFKRWATHLTSGARKYAKRNWMMAQGEEELQRFRESAVRHFEQWLQGETDEDHAAAVFFNINGAEYVKSRLASTNRR